MNIVIIEDEKLAMERLQILLEEYDPSIKVVGALGSLEDALTYFKTKPQPDVLLLDIHVADGNGLELFKQINYSKPVIFVTAFDQYALDAFKMMCVDYILKPVTLEALATAFNKLRNMPQAFQWGHEHMSTAINEGHYKKRFLAKIGKRLHFIDTIDISYFQADNKIVYVIDREGRKLLVDVTIEGLETLVDPKQFFRLNRRYLINAAAIEQVKTYFNKRLRVWMKGAPAEEEIVVSREKVAEFKAWAEV